MGDLGPEFLCYVLQGRLHFRFIYPAEPLDEVVDRRAFRKVLEEGV